MRKHVHEHAMAHHRPEPRRARPRPEYVEVIAMRDAWDTYVCAVRTRAPGSAELELHRVGVQGDNLQEVVSRALHQALAELDE